MLLTREQVRKLDRLAIEEFGIPALVLMENAGRNLAELLISLGVHGRVLICCGKGNNGGDGLVAARHLVNHGCSVRILFFARPDELSPECAVHWKVVTKMKSQSLSINEVGLTPTDESLRQEFAQADWIVDGLFGTGLKGALRAPFDGIVNVINASGKKVLAVDIPSGLDADTGEPCVGPDGKAGVAVRANHTGTFVAMKAGLARPAATAWTGQVTVLDIGAPASLVRSIASC